MCIQDFFKVSGDKIPMYFSRKRQIPHLNTHHTNLQLYYENNGIFH